MSIAAWRIPLGFGALCLVALPAVAAVLGDLELRSQAGAPLEARIPVVGSKNEALRGACFSVDPRGAIPLPEATLELRRSAHGTSLFVRTRAPVPEGAGFAIAIACPGASRAPAVEYSVRFAARAALPLPRTTSVAAPSPVATSAAAPLPVVTSLAAREGDTLASLTEAFFPRDRVARARYLQALRAENEALAAFGDEEPLTPGTTVALPDLHAFAATLPARRAATPSPAASLRAAHAPGKVRDSKGTTRIAAAPVAHDSGQRASLPASRDEHREAAGDGFRLRLSAPVLDLAPSRSMDPRKRAELRERLLALEADDRTAAMLAMRENIRRLESQVSELELKLAAMPSAPPVHAQPPGTTPPRTDAPKVAAPKPETPRIEAERAQAPKMPNTDTPRIETPQVQAPKAETPKAQTPKENAAAESTAPASRPAARPHEERRRPLVVPRAPGAEPWYSDLLWWLRLLLVPLAGVLGLRYFARRRAAATDEYGYGEEELAPGLAITAPGADAAQTEPRLEVGGAGGTSQEAATRVPAEDNLELRRRYMEERFPEIANGAVALEDARSIVKAARLLYDDGAIARAIELLQFAIEQDPDAMPAWLALFAIFRLQGLPGEFAELAHRFAERHGARDEWSDVRAIGRTLDAANPLYEGEEVIAAMDGGPEGWLRGAGDAPPSPLAGELRSRLMAEASVTDADLAPDPIAALRKAEVFSVA